jgi:Fe-S cluster assembly iron-binding protein IscA
MALINLDPAASQAIKSLLADLALKTAIRVELRFTGCCDPSLGLLVDRARESDLVDEVDGLTFVIDPQTQELAGEVSIGYKPETGAFVLTSANPIGEWDGMVTCNLRR